MAIAVGMIIAWGSNVVGLHCGGLSVKGIVAVFLYALSRYPALAPALAGSAEVMAATPE